MRMSKKRRLELAIEALRRGPSFLDPSEDAIGYGLNRLSYGEREAIRRAYLGWLETWVLHNLEGLA